MIPMETTHGVSIMQPLSRKQGTDTAGVTIEAVRFYEREGPIDEPSRTESGYRQYPQGMIARIRFIKRAQNLGFSLPDVKKLLSLRMSPETTPADIRQRAVEKIADIENKIRSLQSMQRILEEITNACHGEGTLSDYPILKALEK